MRIVILVLSARSFAHTSATLSLLARHWHKHGHKVYVSSRSDRPPPGDIAINHVDLTRTPQDFQKAFARYPVVINGRLLDISKRRVSDQLVQRDDAYQGPVIVKTDQNFGGAPEVNHALQRGELTSEEVRAWTWADKRKIRPEEYPVLDGKDEVPADVWENPHLVVERYLPERTEDGRLWTRCWNFLGDRGFHVRVTAPDPVLRGPAISERQVLDPSSVPAAVRAKRQALQMDYGRIDYAEHQGRTIVYDCNRTPATSAGAMREYQELIEDISYGIEAFRQP